MNSVLLTVVAAALTGPLVQDTQPSNRQGLSVDRCLVALIDDISVPSREAGLLDSLSVKEGDEIQAGVLLAKLDPTDAISTKTIAGFEVAIADRQARSMVEVDAAEKAWEVSREEMNESVEINKLAPGTVAKTQVRRERLTAQRAEYQFEAAKVQHEVAGDTLGLRTAEMEAAQNRLARHDIRSPLDGVVVEIHRRPGTWVQPGDPVIRVVRMNRLRVEGLVEGDLASPAQLEGSTAKVVVNCGRDGDQEIIGVVDFVSPIVQANGKYKVWVEIENKKVNGQWIIRPGLEARMDIELKQVD